MAITAFSNPVNGLWPLGSFTISTPGTVIQLNQNVGPQTQGATAANKSSEFARAFMIFAGTNNQGPVYLMRNVKGQTVSAAGTPNFICAIIYPGSNLNLAGFATAALNPDDYCLDASSAGSTVVVTAVVPG